MNLRRWLAPGIGIKRWLVVVFAGLLAVALAFAHFLRQITRDLEPGGLAGTLIDLVTLQFLPFVLRGLIAGTLGVALVALGAYRVIRALIDPLQKGGVGPATGRADLPEALPRAGPADRGDRWRDGPVHAVARPEGVHQQSDCDRDRRRRRWLVGRAPHRTWHPAVGDIRNCIAALADAEPLMSDVLQYRFPEGVGGDGRGLAGHALGNLLIAADDRGRGRRLRGWRPG